MTTEGEDFVIVLRRSPYAETSLLLSLLGQRIGKFRAIARGAHRLRESHLALLDLFSQAHIHFRSSSKSSLFSIKNAELAKPFLPLLTPHLNLLAASYFASLVETSIADCDPQPQIFLLLSRALDWLNSNTPSLNSILLFEDKLAKFLGILDPKSTSWLSLQHYIQNLTTPMKLRQELLNSLPKIQ
ncbi:MAG: DNA repair protein RecO [Chthoniobacterales bacterium]|nr:DNA repair protein RecO [Chthoniobacterales bacterium]MCX7713578.1 DNA repair protein RecO [Chthoniobacterales bacterium]